MSEYLKGNYSVPSSPAGAAPTASPATEQFEAHALKKLGGSVAFIKKSAGFVWKGDGPKPPGDRAGESSG